MEMEFVKIKELVPLMEVNTTATREHVAMIEQKIRHVKQRVRETTREYPIQMDTGHCVRTYHLFLCLLAKPIPESVREL